MQERQVTVGGSRHPLPDPFFVLATQNPIEQEGTYPLPEAQHDRFMFKVFVKYPNFRRRVRDRPPHDGAVVRRGDPPVSTASRSSNCRSSSAGCRSPTTSRLCNGA